MKQLKEELEKSGYKTFSKNFLKPHGKYFYQKNMGEYYINCTVYDNHYEDVVGDIYEFDVQFSVNGKSINITTVSWFSDILEKYRPYPTLKEVENVMKKLYLAYKKC